MPFVFLANSYCLFQNESETLFPLRSLPDAFPPQRFWWPCLCSHNCSVHPWDFPCFACLHSQAVSSSKAWAKYPIFKRNMPFKPSPSLGAWQIAGSQQVFVQLSAPLALLNSLLVSHCPEAGCYHDGDGHTQF